MVCYKNIDERGFIMGLFGLGKKRVTMSAPVTGKFQSLENVNDQVFSQKMMGEGYGVVPTAEEVYSPISGTVESVFQTKHAIGLKTSDGLEVLIHMGIDTVELKGEPFDVLVSKGDKVTNNTILAKMDLHKLAESGKDNVVITLITNSVDKIEKINFSSNDDESVNHGDQVMESKVK